MEEVEILPRSLSLSHPSLTALHPDANALLDPSQDRLDWLESGCSTIGMAQANHPLPVIPLRYNLQLGPRGSDKTETSHNGRRVTL